MKYNVLEYKSLLVDPKCFYDIHFPVTKYLSKVEKFLIDAYQGRFVCFVKKNFPDLYANLNQAASYYGLDYEQFIKQELNLTPIRFNVEKSKVKNIIKQIKQNVVGNTIFVEDNPQLFFELTKLKELMLSQEMIDEEGVLKRFSSKLKLVQKEPQFPLPTRLNIFLKIAELTKAKQAVTEESIGKACYQKLVYVAASIGLNIDEYISAFVQPYLKHKPLNVTGECFETEYLKDYFEDVKPYTVNQHYSRPIKSLENLGFTLNQVKDLCGIHARQIISDTSSAETKYTGLIEKSPSKYFYYYLPLRSDYLSIQQKEYIDDLYVACKVLFHYKENLVNADFNSKSYIERGLNSFGINPEKFYSFFPSVSEKSASSVESIKPLKVQNTEARYKARLLELYPDKFVIELRKKDLKLYQNLVALAQYQSVSISEYLKSLGFKYDSKSKQSYTNAVLTKYKEQLIAMYGDQPITDLFKRNKALYFKIIDAATYRKLSIKQFIEKMGLRYVSAEDKQMQNYKEELEKIYGKGPVLRLAENYPILYGKIAAHARTKKVPIAQIINSLGFEYSPLVHQPPKSKPRPNKILLEDLYAKLLEIYPNRIVVKLSQHNVVYKKILYYAKTRNVSVSQLLQDLGFVLGATKDKYNDIKTKLSALYPDGNVVSLTRRDVALYQRIQSVAHAQKKSIKQVIEEFGFNYVYDRKATAVNLGITCTSEAYINALKQSLLEAYPDKIITNLKASYPKLYSKIQSLASIQETNIKEVIKSLGFTYNVSGNRLTKEENFDKIKQELENIYPNHIVKDLKNKDHKLLARIRYYAYLQKTPINEFMRSIGFTYHANIKKKKTTNSRAIKAELLNIYTSGVVENLSTNKTLYNKILNQAKRKNATVKEYIESLGFSYKDSRGKHPHKKLEKPQNTNIPKTTKSKSAKAKVNTSACSSISVPGDAAARLYQQNPPLYYALQDFCASHGVQLTEAIESVNIALTDKNISTSLIVVNEEKPVIFMPVKTEEGVHKE